MAGDLSVADDIAHSEVFLRAGTKLEPLVYSWPAWSHLIAPVQSAANLAFRYLPLMESFVRNPKAHAAAALDPSLSGGSFINLPESQVGSVADRVAAIRRGAGRSLALAKDLRGFERYLQDAARGYGLEQHYAAMPPSLRGLLELSYDLSNRPRLRLIEELIYADKLHSGASTVLISSIPDHERPFFMAAPRIPTAADCSLTLELSDPRIDALANMRMTPQPLETARQLLGCRSPGACKFLTGEPPIRREPQYRGGELRVRYFGHACVLVQVAGESVLVDPFVAWDRSPGDQRYTYEDLPDRIDYVVITHGHQDHFCVELLMQLRSRIGTVIVPRTHAGEIADPSLSLILKHLGFSRVAALDRFDRLETRSGSITSLPFPGEHADLDIHGRQSVLVESRGRKLLFLADSSAADPYFYERLGRLLAPVQAVFIGMECVGAPLSWLYGPLLGTVVSRQDDGSRRLAASTCEKAWRLLQHVSAESVYVYAMGQEPWMQYVMGLQYEENSRQLTEVRKFLGICMESGKKAERLHLSREFHM